MAIIEFKDVSFCYPNGFPALEHVTFSIKEESNIAIIGQNGAGKTTTVKMMNGLLKPTEGNVVIDGMNTHEYTTAALARKTGYVFQNPGDQIFHSTVREEIAFGPQILGKTSKEIRELVDYSAEQTGLQDKLEKNPYDLPMALRKFVGVASVLAMDTKIIVLDEPTAGQDYCGIQILENILKSLQAKGKTVITITHDMEFVVENFKEVYVMAHKNFLRSGTPEEIFADDTLLEESMLDKPFYNALAISLRMDKQIVTRQQFVQAYFS